MWEVAASEMVTPQKGGGNATVGDFTIIIIIVITKQRERNSPFVHQACVVLHQVFAEGTKEAEALVGERLWCKHKPLQHRRAVMSSHQQNVTFYF